MRIRDGPAAVRGDAPPPRSHWPKPGRRRGREPRVRRPVALLISRTPRGREASGASCIRPTRRCGAGCARRLGRRCVRWRFGHVVVVVVPGHRRRVQRQGHGQETACPHRLAVSDGDREPVRHRRRLAGGRRRRPVRLSEERTANGALGLHSQRRGDRHVSTRPRRHRLRPEGTLGRARATRHHRPPPGRREELQGRVPADPAARARHWTRRRGEAGRHRHEGADREDHERRQQGPQWPVRLPRAHARSLLGDVEDLRRAGLYGARPAQHRRRGGLSRLRVSRSCPPNTSSRRAPISSCSPTRSAAGRRPRRSPLARAGIGSAPCAPARSSASTTRSRRVGGRAS